MPPVCHAAPLPLDPIVSLSVAIAEAPGSYAFLLGSGVSRDAGVPTGGEVFWRAVGDLNRLEETVDETPPQSSLTQWLADNGQSDIGYSDVLELIAPDAATRRDYLAKLSRAWSRAQPMNDWRTLRRAGSSGRS